MSEKFLFDDFLLDPQEKILFRGGKPISLTPKAFDLLVHLVSNHGHLVEKNALINALWPESFVEEANLPFTIGLLRKALGDSAHQPRFIETVSKRGYRFIARVRTTSDVRIDAPAQHPYVLTGTACVIIFALFAAAFVWFKGDKTGAARGSDHRLTTSGKVTISATSPDGRILVFAQREGDGEALWRRDLASGEETPVLADEPVEFVGLAISPDNAYAYYSVFADNAVALTLRRVPLTGGAMQPLDQIESDVSVSFSPDGKRFAYTESHTARDETLLRTANSDGSDVRTLLTLKGESRVFPVFRASPVAWSPDGNVIACAIQEGRDTESYFRVVLVNPDDGSERYLSDQRWDFVEQIAWKDDDTLALANWEPNAAGADVWLVSRVSGKASKSSSGGLNRWLSAGGGRLFSVEAKSNSAVYVADFPESFARPQSKQILEEAGVIDNLVWPTADVLYYNSWATGKNEIWSVAADGTLRQQRTTDSNLTHGFTVSPKDGTIVLAAQIKSAVSLFLTDADGRKNRQLTNGVYHAFPRFLSDGKQVIYQEGSLAKTVLWRVSTDGSEPARQITGYFALQPSISPDGTAIAYHFMDFSEDPKRWKIAVMDAGSGRLLNKLNFPFPITERKVVWHPTENLLTMVFAHGERYSLLLLNPADNSYETINDVASGKISAFAWSPDGRRLAFVDNQTVSDVVRLDPDNQN